jgi:predicted nucleic acid-binding Zn ribbon protein
MEIKRTCPVCGDAITGRIDKKFCSDQCRNEFNNKKYQGTNCYIRRINYALRKNRRILEELYAEGKTRISKGRLVNRGFDFRYITGLYRSKRGNTYYYCYDHGYLHLGNDFYALVRRDDYTGQVPEKAVTEKLQPPPAEVSPL